MTCSNLTDYENHAKSSHGRQQATVTWQTTTDLVLDKQENPAEYEQCPLCCSTPRGSRRVFVNHVARHMEQIALLALPRATEESDDEAERDGSESLADTISTSDGQRTALKPGPLKDRDDWARFINEGKKKLSRSPSPCHIEPPASPMGKFVAQPRAPLQSWLLEHDELLMQARMQGLGWQHIASTYFPYKTANACRKRHERLQEKRIKAKQEYHFDNDAATVGSIGLLTLPDKIEGAIDKPRPLFGTDAIVGLPRQQAMWYESPNGRSYQACVRQTVLGFSRDFNRLILYVDTMSRTESSLRPCTRGRPRG